MIKRLLQSFTRAFCLSANVSVNTNCGFIIYQPKVPEEAKVLKKY